jgi:hypothetical protein
MKTVAIFLIVMGFYNYSFSQQNKINIGIKGTLNISGFTDRIGYYGESNSHFFDSRLYFGYSAGTRVEYSLANRISAGLDLAYDHIGSKYKSNVKYTTQVRERTELRSWTAEGSPSVKIFKLNYIEAPVYLSFKYKINGKWQHSIYSGISGFLNISSKYKYNYYQYKFVSPNLRFEDAINVKEKIFYYPANPFNYALLAGGFFYNPEANFGLDIRFTYLMNDIYRVTHITTYNFIITDTTWGTGYLETSESDMRTKLWIISISVYFRIK